MAELAVQEIDEAGLSPAFAAAAAGGDSVVDDGSERMFIAVKNGGGGVITVTVTAQRTAVVVGGFGRLTNPDIQVAVAAAGERWIGPFPRAFRDTVSKVQVSYSGVAAVTIAAVKLPAASR